MITKFPWFTNELIVKHHKEKILKEDEILFDATNSFGLTIRTYSLEEFATDTPNLDFIGIFSQFNITTKLVPCATHGETCNQCYMLCIRGCDYQATDSSYFICQECLKYLLCNHKDKIRYGYQRYAKIDSKSNVLEFGRYANIDSEDEFTFTSKYFISDNMITVCDESFIMGEGDKIISSEGYISKFSEDEDIFSNGDFFVNIITKEIYNLRILNSNYAEHNFLIREMTSFIPIELTYIINKFMVLSSIY